MARLLPVNVVERIGQHLRDSDDRRSVVECARVTRRWTEGMLRALYKCPRLVQHDSFEALLAVLGATVPGSRGLVGYGKDRVVGLDSSDGGSDNQVITYASLVAELDLCGAAADNVYIGDLDGALALCSNLRILRLGSVFHMSNMIVQSVATHCLNLLQLELPGCPVSDAFVPLLAKTCAKLLRFDAAFTNLSVGSLVPLVSFASSLLELDLSECREPDPNLNLSAKDLRRPLKFLNLRNTQISDSLLTFTISNCPVLEILVLESCSKLSDASITLLFAYCPQLRSVDLSFCDSLTDASLAAIPATTKLEELYLSGLDLISAYAVHALVRRLRFNTSNLAGVEKSASTLELLVLDGCEQIVGSFIKGFAAVGDDLECELEKDGLLRLAAVPVEGEAEQENGNVPSSVTSPTIAAGMLTPVVQMQSMMSDLKVEVSYADREMHVLRNKGESKYVGSVAGKASVMSPQPEPARMQQPHPHDQHQRSHEDAEYRALADSVAASGSVAQRRASKTLRHRKSLLGLSSRQEQEDSEEVHEAAKLERVEKIKEKRRSGGAGNFFGAGGAGGIHSTSSSGPARTSFIGGSGSGPSLSTLDLHERFLAAASIPRPASEIDNTASSSGSLPRTHSDPASFGSSAEASKAAFLAAAAAKGLKISAPDASDGPRLIKKRPSSILRANVAEFVPLSPPTANSAMDEEPAYVAPVNNDSKVNRRISVGVPAGPPPPDSRLAAWNGIGSSASPMGSGSSPSMTPGYLPGSSPLAAAPVQQIVTPTGESGVLLFSGRKSARMSVNRDSLPPMNGFPQQSSDGIASVERNDSVNAAGEESPVVIASGRRRTRGTSIVDESKAVSAAIQVATGIPQRSSPPPPQAAALPLWATAPAAPPAVAPTGPWGTDPTVWNNPAQLTSASSTWSSNGPQQQTGFADPWAGSRAAASPAPSGPGVGMGEPATSVLGPAPVINSMDPWAAAPASAANAVTPPSAVVNAAAAAAAVNPSMSQPGPASVQSWQQQQQQQLQQPKMIPQRPTVPSSRFGGVGTISNIMSTPAGLLANPAGLGGRGAAPQMQHGYQQQQQALSGNHGEGGSGGGFVYSAQNRGRLLLKLKIETKIGGEQMLAVHEYDDPQQLATEFVNYWELQAFKDPLVRLIAVRKTNVLRNRGAMNV